MGDCGFKEDGSDRSWDRAFGSRPRVTGGDPQSRGERTPQVVASGFEGLVTFVYLPVAMKKVVNVGYGLSDGREGGSLSKSRGRPHDCITGVQEARAGRRVKSQERSYDSPLWEIIIIIIIIIIIMMMMMIITINNNNNDTTTTTTTTTTNDNNNTNNNDTNNSISNDSNTTTYNKDDNNDDNDTNPNTNTNNTNNKHAKQ